MLNTSITSKEAILQVCRDIVASKGLAAVNMRSVADKSQIALGTLYNYYDNKDELLLATVEEIWKDIFHMDHRCPAELSFPKYVEYIFECVQKGAENYPDFFSAHSICIANSEKEKAKCTMKHCFKHMKEGLLEVLQTDSNVSVDAFSTSFEKLDFIDFVLDNLLMLLVQGKKSCEMLIEIIQRTIY
ncbi:MAG: TetR/AcrR family transcriptional regulator [Clostridium sp.]|nr:TetR/AcrR family transcriptional regulator [Clostridium sp.]